MILIELAVESLAAAQAAAEGGANRIELCADLSVGGLTPSGELTRSVLDAIDIPVFAMARSRPGNFVYSRQEIAALCPTIEQLHSLGVQGVVSGALTDAGKIDRAATAQLVSAAEGMPFTFHRAFDRAIDQLAALEQLAELGVTRVLTSGGAPTALEGAERLRELVARSVGRVIILPGGGIRESNVKEIVSRTGVSEVHSKLTDGSGEELTAARVRGFRNALAHVPGVT